MMQPMDNDTSLITNNASTSKEHFDTVECTEGTHVWSKKETILLLQIYSEHKDTLSNGKGTVKQYWEKVAKLMQEKGYNVTGIKCSTKFQARKRTFKVILDHNKKSGNDRKEWEYFEIMQQLFADKPWIQPLSVAESHVDSIEEKENILQEKCTKRRKFNIEEYILQSKEERDKRRQIRAKEHEEKMCSFKRLENLMEKLIEKENKS